MALKTLSFHIKGLTPMLMHNGQLADPMNEITIKIKAITDISAAKRTEAQGKELQHLECLGGLYVYEGKIVVLGECIEAMLVGRMLALGPKRKPKKDYQAGTFSHGPWPIKYTGPKNPEKFAEDMKCRDTRGVKIGKSRIMRTRPKLNDWELKFDVSYLDNLVNEKDVVGGVKDAGLYGLNDGRPRFGQFEMVSWSNGTG